MRMLARYIGGVVAILGCAFGLGVIWALGKDREQYMSPEWQTRQLGDPARRWQAVKASQVEDCVG